MNQSAQSVAGSHSCRPGHNEKQKEYRYHRCIPPLEEKSDPARGKSAFAVVRVGSVRVSDRTSLCNSAQTEGRIDASTRLANCIEGESNPLELKPAKSNY